MSKVCIVFASMTGNTEEIKEILVNTISKYTEVDVYEMDMVGVDVIEDYDYVLIGSYTYDDGDIPFEAEDFYEELEGLDLSGKYASCFGSGDTLYVDFCNAAVLFEERVIEQGGVIIEPALKIELSPSYDDQKEKCVQFAQRVIEYMGGGQSKTAN
ncbi:flavodoxin [Alteribacillus iranensis]|uniref:Flavodoxin n=1 Tax=Alteribacillus iranensis TaxID=930128 RepID=A0A1I2E550_9BACI|nr:flavodoxin [Alteribacillus iranensis]SFE88062.1 flavodoxin I [Alteribacillus iranensis]